MDWYLITGMFIVGFWGILAEDNLIRKVFGLSFCNSAITLLFVRLGAREGTAPPIIDAAHAGPESTTLMVDPVPHALMLTAIVVGVCIMALAVVLVKRLWDRFGTLSMREIEQQVWHAEDAE